MVIMMLIEVVPSWDASMSWSSKIPSSEPDAINKGFVGCSSSCIYAQLGLTLKRLFRHGSFL